MATESQRRAVAKYDASHTKQYKIKLNYKTDTKLIKYLDECGNIQGTIKQALEEHMERDNKK